MPADTVTLSSRCAGECCTGTLTEDLTCCDETLDSCGVCNGDNSGCNYSASLNFATAGTVSPAEGMRLSARVFDALTAAGMSKAQLLEATVNMVESADRVTSVFDVALPMAAITPRVLAALRLSAPGAHPRSAATAQRAERTSQLWPCALIVLRGGQAVSTMVLRSCSAPGVSRVNWRRCAGVDVASASDTTVALRTRPPISKCDENLCTTGQAATCPVSNACKPTTGTCAPPPLNREPGAVCGGAAVGYCAAARNVSAVSASCVCAAPYAGADCGLCAPGFYAVAHAPWGSSGERCVQTPPDMRQLAAQRAATYTEPSVSSSKQVTSWQPPAPPQASKTAAAYNLWIAGGCALLALLVAAAIAACCRARPPRWIYPLQRHGTRRRRRGPAGHA